MGLGVTTGSQRPQTLSWIFNPQTPLTPTQLRYCHGGDRSPSKAALQLNSLFPDHTTIIQLAIDGSSWQEQGREMILEEWASEQESVYIKKKRW